MIKRGHLAAIAGASELHIIAHVIAEQMRNPRTKRSMANLALSYERLAKHAATREAVEAAGQKREQGRNEAA
jgi:hypothetical protein